MDVRKIVTIEIFCLSKSLAEVTFKIISHMQLQWMYYIQQKMLWFAILGFVFSLVLLSQKETYG